ncbi:membrane protein, partial [Pseudomonas syringae pv. actinidiae ICMP 9855]
QILLDSTARVAINEQAVTKLKQWVLEWQVLNKQISDIRRRWLYPNAYKNNEYARLLQDEIRQYFQSGKTLAKDWLARAKGWTDRLGGTA